MCRAGRAISMLLQQFRPTAARVRHVADLPLSPDGILDGIHKVIAMLSRVITIEHVWIERVRLT
ncbi:hypothetical protein DIE15_11635 [Burkholderia sp. Bp9031]|nr:hypothetical protein DIE15_11635 [Burkholderia sp. Bp9031]